MLDTFPLLLSELEAAMDFLLDFLEFYLRTPEVFLAVLFVFSILAAIVLPIPVEIALIPLLRDPALLTSAALVLGAGKAVGAGAVFLLGLKVEGPIRYWCARHPALGRTVGYVTRFVRVTRWWGLLVLLSIPFMSDTFPIYLYALFNKQGQLIGSRIFLLVNFAAGVIRTFAFVILASMGYERFLAG